MRLVCFIIRIFHDAPSPERQIRISFLLEQSQNATNGQMSVPQTILILYLKSTSRKKNFLPIEFYTI